MLIDSVYVAGTAAYLPQIEPLSHAVPPDRRATLQQVSAITSPDLAGPQLAARAAQLALRRSETPPEDVDLHLHATMYDQGLEIWSASAYVAEHAGLSATCSFEVRQCSNGGMGALQLAARQLTATGGSGSALITTGDRFAGSRLDRWMLDPGLVVGDAGGALVLARERGCARLVSVGWAADNGLEGVHRGHEPLALDRATARVPVDLGIRTKEFLEAGTMETAELRRRLHDGQRRAVEAAFDGTGWTLDEVDHVVAPNFGRELLNEQCLAPLGIPEDKTLWASFGRIAAHLGSGDHVVGLDRLLSASVAQPGDRVMLLSAGGGFAWTVALVEVLAIPSWSAGAPEPDVALAR
jgi:3-oxoacyl-[acyl-carrier-protein] synthase-3